MNEETFCNPTHKSPRLQQSTTNDSGDVEDIKRVKINKFILFFLCVCHILAACERYMLLLLNLLKSDAIIYFYNK